MSETNIPQQTMDTTEGPEPSTPTSLRSGASPLRAAASRLSNGC